MVDGGDLLRAVDALADEGTPGMVAALSPPGRLMWRRKRICSYRRALGGLSASDRWRLWNLKPCGLCRHCEAVRQ